MVLAGFDRALSGLGCSCSPHSSAFRISTRHCHQARRRQASHIAKNAGTLEYAEEITEPESELLSRDLLEEKFAGEQGAQISRLQALERLKGHMRSALLDLEEPSHGFSESDREKLHLARQRHAFEEHEADLDVLKERRKADRAAKRAARKEATRQRVEEPIAADYPQAVSRSRVTVGSTAASRRADKAVARQGAIRPKGAKAFASSRTRMQARWGRQHSLEADVPLEKPNGSTSGPAYTAKGGDSYHDYLKNMPKHDLLTITEEAALSKRVQAWVVLQNKLKELSKKLDRTPSSSEWAQALNMDEDHLHARLQDGNEARSKMLMCNQRLVVSIALKYQDKGLELSDLIAEGMSGLARGVEKYDYKKGFKFSTYATWWVRQAISRAIGELSKTIRLPCHLVEVLGRINRLESEYKGKYDTYPTETYTSKMLNIPVEKIRMLKRAAMNPKALEDPVSVGDDEAGSFGDTLEDNSVEDIQESLVTGSMEAEVELVLGKLSSRESGILRMRYGLDDGQPKTLEDIGLAFKVTRERIRQIENKAMAKLKGLECARSLRPFVNGEAADAASDEVGWKSNIVRTK